MRADGTTGESSNGADKHDPAPFLGSHVWKREFTQDKRCLEVDRVGFLEFFDGAGVDGLADTAAGVGDEHVDVRVKVLFD